MLAKLLMGAAALAMAPGAGAQEALPDPAAVVVPDLSGSADPAVVDNGWKYFFYHRAGTSFAEAHADLADCYRFLTPAGWGNVALPRFVPWVERPAGQRYDTNNQAGLVGLAIGGMIEGTLSRRDRQSKMRRCMEPRGYTRYGVAEEIWESVADMPPAKGIAVQAKIASGPTWGGKEPVK
ncbi:MAG: hypothetical protein HEQ22_09435 [Sphingopyxis sp.]|uniref:hypothetical protein n=1 Tax=Sphingopyxis sp. TaxID=1908224 RepID=UPI003D80CC2C